MIVPELVSVITSDPDAELKVVESAQVVARRK